MATGLKVTRLQDENWREAVERIASEYGLQDECLTDFDDNIKVGLQEPQAAFDALYEWDCLDFDE